MNTATLYLTASSRHHGALGIFHVYGGEALLARALDARAGGKSGAAPANKLSVHELRYGWLRGADGETIDEVMLACPAEGQRVLMTHGGRVIREQTEAYLEGEGFAPLADSPGLVAGLGDPLLDLLLASCVTEGQAAAVLAARESGDASGLERVLVQRRVVLAGAPNAGKSSLLNALAGYDRAFVDAEAGATRDVVDELVDLAGFPVWVGDTPGHMGASGGIEGEAWRRAERRLRLAESVWFVVDGSEAWGGSAEAAASAVAAAAGGEGGTPVLVVVNKADLPLRLAGEPWRRHFPGAPAVFVSTLPEGDAVDVLEEHVAGAWSI